MTRLAGIFTPIVTPFSPADTLDEPAQVDTSGYDWVIVTSPNGANLFAERRAGTVTD